MTDYKTLDVSTSGAVVRIVLNRPEVRNAFDEVLIGELSDALASIAKDDAARVVILTGHGSVFSAGADLNWMKRVAKYGYDENLADALTFARMVESLYRCPKATIAVVNGPCIGGGVGLISACDVAITSSEAHFALREILLGIAPATISPYVLRKIGERAAHDYFLTGRRFDAERAYEIGLVNDVVAPGELEEATGRWTRRFMRAGPEAVKVTKELINRVAWASIEESQRYTAETIARLRGSEEGQEGFAAFFEKRKPSWDDES
jgi:methylglutaconyl-CoA hydratase